ncbi:head GIN domain-containing protein [Polaribacter sp. HL-MS24]|uniref:head GIN domain-containing protein n=1 Tax=Polaribacter sp. HL-MS24 TaxID=3077735 RepID=UPI0029341FDA|nr:head GIN domain-containing protein [Polaribacter sp. HL-MS24]WOC40465.1 head GIN domain-containing protein [Polaribacter sp. HL-MS24]
MKTKFVITSMLLFFSYTMNAQDWWRSKNRIKGNGNQITKTRTVSSFNEINVGGSFEVILVKGTEGKITIEAEENIIPYIETEVDGDRLKIQYKRNTNIRSTKSVTIRVQIKDLESVSLGGSGKISSEDLIKAKDFKVNIGGSGNIDLHLEVQNGSASIGGSGNLILRGKAEKMRSKIAGSGSIKAYAFTADDLNASIAGSGNIKITVQTKIKAKVVGSGNIYYKGNPKHVDTKSIGSGDVIDKN